MTHTSTIPRLCQGTLLVVVLFLSQPAEAQLLVSAARPIGFSPRGFALADAYCADWDDVTSMYGNPGALGNLRQSSIVIAHHVDWATQTATELVAFPLTINEDIALGFAGTIGRNGKLVGLDGTEFAFSFKGGDLATSVRIMPTLSLGLLVGIREYAFADNRMTTGWVHIGFLYNPTPGISYGITYRTRGSALRVIGGQQASLERESQWPADLEIGAAMTYPARSGSPIVTLALTTEKSFPAIQRFNTKGGLEIYPLQFVALRIGYKVGSSNNVARYGAGVRFNRFRMDVGIAPSSAEERSHMFSLSYLL
jgi:hypothetical protein